MSRCAFCSHFATGREEGCKVPSISAGAPHPSTPCVPGFGVCPGIFCTHFATALVRRKRVGFLRFLQGSLALACLQVYFLLAFRFWSGGSVWDPLISAEVPPSTHQGPHNFSKGSLALACVQVYLLLASISRRVPQFSAGSLALAGVQVYFLLALRCWSGGSV